MGVEIAVSVSDPNFYTGEMSVPPSDESMILVASSEGIVIGEIHIVSTGEYGGIVTIIGYYPKEREWKRLGPDEQFFPTIFSSLVFVGTLE